MEVQKPEVVAAVVCDDCLRKQWGIQILVIVVEVFGIPKDIVDLLKKLIDNHLQLGKKVIGSLLQEAEEWFFHISFPA